MTGVSSFVGEDTTGSFGILPGHTRFITLLTFGLARFRRGDRPWQYLAVPGALLYFVDGTLTITSRHFLIDEDYEAITSLLQKRVVAEERELSSMKESLRSMEEELFRRLWEQR
ncbi:MAG: F0F1 ATP synthase subunit epsilon [Halieaceae bacterium]|nr:F0F1 ATP synthase subunit epsilon [Halieaceae bacterium]